MKPIFNRAPLTPNTLSPLPLGSVKPEGWLLEEIRMQLAGITADFAAACPELDADGKWQRAADGDLTRSVYYMEGVIHLAWTMDDEGLKQKARAWVDGVIASQEENGWFGPEGNDDYWPLMLALRALRAYFTAENDKRVLVLMDRFFKYEYKHLADHPLKELAADCLTF